MCTHQKSYMFSEVNNGPPKGTCREEILDYIDSNSIYLAAFLISIGTVGLLGFGASFGIYYIKKDYKQMYKFQKF